MMYHKTIASIFFTLFITTSLFSQTTVTYFENKNQFYNESYGFKLLKLALEKTKTKYGEYKLVKTPKMNKQRAILTLRSNSLENFIIKLSTSKKMAEEFSYIHFPVDRGIVGYRIAFLSPAMEQKIQTLDSVESLKKYMIVQGRGWLDTEILRYNGFRVKTINSLESAYNMISLNRADLFFRGANEVLNEYNKFKNLNNVIYDKKFLLYYPLPRFFYVHKSNKKIMIRVEEGLKLAYEDGSLDKLFFQFYKKSIDFVELNKRKLYKIDNPYLKGIDKDYEQYIYDPFK